jgi:hypothetical protein
MNKYLLVINPDTKDIKILEHVRTKSIIGYVNIFKQNESPILRFWDILKDTDNLEDIIGTDFVIENKERK